MSEFTPRQRAALSFAALVQASAPWRDINVPRLSFTEPGWDPASQLFGSLDACFAALRLAQGCAAALGFAALDADDAVALEKEWADLLEQAPDGSISVHSPQWKERP